jgi:predicted RNA-binding protein associated with RNAse of E/G family
MKRKRADRLDWQRVTKRRFAMTYIEDGFFRGYVTLLCIDEVNAPLFRAPAGLPVCLADNGYKWLQHFPDGSRYAITTILDQQNDVVRWYIDICNRHYRDQQGVLWFEDLYLDIDVAVDGSAALLDVDELDEALRLARVSSLEYEIAWREAENLLHAIEIDAFPLLWQSAEHAERLLALIERNA